MSGGTGGTGILVGAHALAVPVLIRLKGIRVSVTDIVRGLPPDH